MVPAAGAAPPPPPPPFRVLFATPLNSNTIRVFLSQQPRAISQLGSTDALLRANWVISLVAPAPPGVTAPVVERVEGAQPQPAIDPLVPTAWSIDVRTDRRLIQAATYLIVGDTAIQNFSGTLTLAPDPDDRDDLPGITVLRQRVVPRPPGLEGERLDYFYDTFEGQYRLDPSTDLATHKGDAALKKRIIRRLLSTPGGFSHLAGYGAGIRVKELFSSTGTGELQAAITRQVRLEEEVERVAVDATFSAGVLFVGIRVRTRARRTFILNLAVPEDGQIQVG